MELEGEIKGLQKALEVLYHAKTVGSRDNKCEDLSYCIEALAFDH